MINIDYRENENTLIITYSNPLDIIQDTIVSMNEIRKILDSTDGDLYSIADMRGIEITFADLTQGMAQAFSTPDSVYANPRLTTYTVGDSELVRLGTEAVSKQDQYGKIAIKLYSSVEEALEAINQSTS